MNKNRSETSLIINLLLKKVFYSLIVKTQYIKYIQTTKNIDNTEIQWKIHVEEIKSRFDVMHWIIIEDNTLHSL